MKQNNDKQEIWYSIDEEVFNYIDPYDAIDAIVDRSAPNPGETITIWSGVSQKRSASDFVPSFFIIDEMSQQAWEECGEIVDDWPFCSKEQEQELKQMIEKVVDEWADKHNLQPTFFGIKDVKKHDVMIMSYSHDTGEFDYQFVNNDER